MLSVQLGEFQFLLVRLKVLKGKSVGNRKYISIPSGTIKSMSWQAIPIDKLHFNSFWYD